MGVGNKLPRDIAQFVCRTRPFVDTILLSSTEMRVHRSRPCRWITTIDKGPVNEFPLVKFSSLANQPGTGGRWSDPSSDRQITTSSASLGGDRGKVSRPNVHNSSGFASILNSNISTDISSLVRIIYIPSHPRLSLPCYEHYSDSILEIHEDIIYISWKSSIRRKVVHTVYPFEIKVGVKTEIDGIREEYPVEEACTLTLLAVWPRYRSSISIYHAVIPSFFVGINIGENDNHGDKYRASGSKHVATAIPRVNPTMPPLQHSTPKNPISYFHDV